jgi:hypothetical protein
LGKILPLRGTAHAVDTSARSPVRDKAPLILAITKDELQVPNISMDLEKGGSRLDTVLRSRCPRFSLVAAFFNLCGLGIKEQGEGLILLSKVTLTSSSAGGRH